MPHDILQQQISRAPRFEHSPELMIQFFDAEFYLDANKDVAAVARNIGKRFARDHYFSYGFKEKRSPMRLDNAWYASQYPLAAFEVAQGDYADFCHHYTVVGWARGYRPYPGAIMTRRSIGAGKNDESLRPRITVAGVADQVVVVEANTPPRTEPANAAFERQFDNTKVNPFLGWNPNPPIIQNYLISKVVLDGEFRGLLNLDGFIQGTGYLLSNEKLEELQVAEGRLITAPVDGTVIIGCNIAHKNYFHWITQSLPAIDFAIRRKGQDEKVVLALPVLNAWQEASLMYLGLNNIQRFIIDDPTKQYAFEKVEFSGILNGEAAFCLSQTVHQTYTRLRSAIMTASPTTKKIYVARADASNRHMRNETALSVELRKIGFEVIVPANHNLVEQIRLFQSASLVVGPHGAGMTNIVFCKPGTIVYELLPSHYPNACFCNLAHTCRLRYWADAFESDGEGLPNLREWQSNSRHIIERLEEIEAIHSAGGIYRR